MEQVFHIQNGRLTCRTKGSQAELTMTLRPPQPGLYRGILCGKNGRMDLGPLLPEGEGLRLSCSIPIDRLVCCGCWPVTGGRGELRHPFGVKKVPQGWEERGDLARLFTDPVLSGAVETTALWRKDPDGFSLAFPWDPRAPFPLTPAFCLARVDAMEGRLWVVYHFRTGGWPTLSPSCQNGDSGVQ